MCLSLISYYYYYVVIIIIKERPAVTYEVYGACIAVVKSYYIFLYLGYQS